MLLFAVVACAPKPEPPATPDPPPPAAPPAAPDAPTLAFAPDYVLVHVTGYKGVCEDTAWTLELDDGKGGWTPVTVQLPRFGGYTLNGTEVIYDKMGACDNDVCGPVHDVRFPYLQYTLTSAPDAPPVYTSAPLPKVKMRFTEEIAATPDCTKTVPVVVIGP